MSWPITKWVWCSRCREFVRPLYGRNLRHCAQCHHRLIEVDMRTHHDVTPTSIIGSRFESAGFAMGADGHWCTDVIEIVTDRGTLIGQAEGDCCSRSWFETIDVDVPPGAVITRYEDDADQGKLPSGHASALEWQDSAQGENKVSFGTFYTDKGRITFELRNESNGYYSGYITWHWKACP